MWTVHFEAVQPFPGIETLLPKEVLHLLQLDDRKALPAIARDQALCAVIEKLVQQRESHHSLLLGDSRQLNPSLLPDESVHLVVTSPPYWTLKEYPNREGQLGAIEDYETFLDELDKVWEQAYRVLVPGGRLVIVVGDVCLPRRRFGRHVVFPLHASIQERCRKFGFDNLSPIIWHKIANATFEAAGNSGRFLGKPYEPNAIIKNDIEFILFQRKPGGYRTPSLEARLLSVIPVSAHKEWFQQIWALPGASTRDHPAPFPLALAERLVRMFSFVGDTVLDPFVGTGTTSIAAARWGRNSIGIDVEPTYIEMAVRRLRALERPRQLELSLYGRIERGH